MAPPFPANGEGERLGDAPLESSGALHQILREIEVGTLEMAVVSSLRPHPSPLPRERERGALLLVAGRTEVHGPLGGVVHFLGREQHDGLDDDGAALICRQRDSGGGRGVGQVDNDICVDIAEGEIDRLQFSAQPFGHLRDGRAAARAPFLGDALAPSTVYRASKRYLAMWVLLREARRRD